MVNIGNLVIDDISLFAFLFIIFGFSYWYYNRVLKALSVKVAWQSKAGDYTIYKASWNVNENSVTMIRSRKDKQILKKKHEPVLMNFGPTNRNLWFRAIEGSKQTQPWGFAIDESGKGGAGYEASGLIQHYITEASEQSVNSMKGQFMGIMIGLGFGIVLGILFASFFPQMF